MDNEMKTNTTSDAQTCRPLCEEEEKIVTGGVATNNMLCPHCKRVTPHIITAKGKYVCNSCNMIHLKI